MTGRADAEGSLDFINDERANLVVAYLRSPAVWSSSVECGVW